MTSYFRYREYGSPDWTEVAIEGELEHLAADSIRQMLESAEELHSQEFVEASWEEI